MQMLTYGRVMPFLELFARIDAVDCAAIMETAEEFIVDKVDILSKRLVVKHVYYNPPQYQIWPKTWCFTNNNTVQCSIAKLSSHCQVYALTLTFISRMLPLLQSDRSLICQS